MTILKFIPRVLPPRLLYVLASMGHGDEIVLADANFPSESVAKANNAEIVRMDAVNVPEVLSAVCKLMPLDTYEKPAAVMSVVDHDVGKVDPSAVWKTYSKIMEQEENIEIKLEEVERFAFYERAKNAYCIVATGESALYGNLILKKGVLGPEA